MRSLKPRSTTPDPNNSWTELTHKHHLADLSVSFKFTVRTECATATDRHTSIKQSIKEISIAPSETRNSRPKTKIWRPRPRTTFGLKTATSLTWKEATFVRSLVELRSDVSPVAVSDWSARSTRHRSSAGFLCCGTASPAASSSPTTPPASSASVDQPAATTTWPDQTSIAIDSPARTESSWSYLPLPYLRP